MNSYDSLRQLDRQTLIGRANELIAATRYNDAIPVLKRLSEIDPQSAEARAALGLACAGVGRYDEAITACRSAFQLSLHSLSAILDNLVRLLSARGCGTSVAPFVLEAYRGGLRDAPATALALDFCTDVDELLQILMNAVTAFPEVPAFHHAFARELEARGRFDEALASARAAVELSSRDSAAQLSLARLLRKLGHYSDAIAILRVLLAEDFTKSALHTELYECLGSAFADGNRVSELEALLAEAPGDDAIRYQLARGLLERREIEKGLCVIDGIGPHAMESPAVKELKARYSLVQGNVAAPSALYHSIWDQVSATRARAAARPPLPARPEVAVNPVLYMPIEIAQRELASRVLIAAYAAQHGLHAVIGPVKSLCRSETAVSLPPGIFIEKTLYRLDWEKVVIAFPGGHRFTAIDEEAMGRTGTDREMLLTVDAPILPLLDLIFLSGARHRAAYEAIYPEYVDRTRATGNPRIDLLDSRYRAALGEETQAIRAKHGDFVLVCTNFSTINSTLFQFSDAVQNFFHVVRKDDPADFAEVLRIAKGAVSAECEYMLAFERMMPQIARCMPDVKFVIRVHPHEAATQWRQMATTFPNIVIDNAGSLQASMAAARSMLYVAGCATGLEACVAREPAVRMLINPDLAFPKLGVSYYLNPAGSTAEEIVDALRCATRGAARRPEDEAIIAEYFTLSESPAASRIAEALGELYATRGRGSDVNLRGLRRAWEGALRPAAARTEKIASVSGFAAAKRVVITPEEVRSLLTVGRKAFGYPDNIEVSALSSETVLVSPAATR